METYLNKICNIESLLLDEKMLIAKEKLEELKKVIIYDMAMKNCKGTKKEQLRNAKQFLLNATKVCEYRPLFHKIYKVDDTFQMCDGFTGIVLNNMIDGLELNTEKGEYMDCRNIINTCNPKGYSYEKVEIDIFELEQQAITVKKVKDNPLPFQYASRIKDVYYNPVYLLRAIKILGTTDVKISINIMNNKAPIYLKSELGEAIVLPIRPPQN